MGPADPERVKLLEELAICIRNRRRGLDEAKMGADIGDFGLMRIGKSTAAGAETRSFKILEQLDGKEEPDGQGKN